MANEYMAHMTDRLSANDTGHHEPVTFSIRCRPHLARRLKVIADHLGVTRNQLVTDLLLQAQNDFVESLKEEFSLNNLDDILTDLLKALEKDDVTLLKESSK